MLPRTPAFRSLFSDCRFAFRQLHRAPSFAVVAILTLALGIGANTAIFSVVNAVLLRALPFSNPSELALISERSTFFDFPYMNLSLADIADLRSARSFSGIAITEDLPRELSSAGNPRRLQSTAVSQEFFPLLGLRPLQGRVFASTDMQPGTRSVLLSESLWRKDFGADASVVGKPVTLDGQTFTIIGVMPAVPPLGFETDSELWTAFIPTPEQLADRSRHDYSVVARLRPHTSLGRAQSDLDIISSRLATSYPDTDKGWNIHVTSLRQYLLGDAQTPLVILFSAVGFVLLIACANVSNLFLARGLARRREFGIRSALGASRWVLIRQLATEALLIALIGGACAFAVSALTLHGLRSILPPDLPRIGEIHIDTSVAWFTVAASLFAVLLAGLAPAVISTRGSLSDAARQDSLSVGTSSSSNFLRQFLVVAEIAVATVLLIGATLDFRSFTQLLRQDLGFRPDHVLTVRLDFPTFRFATAEPAIAYVQQVQQALRSTPGVTAASAGLVFPMSDEVAETTFATDATMADPQHAQQSAMGNRVAPDFFQTLGIPLLRGRDFTVDDAKGKGPVFIVNETLARKYFGTVDAIGKRLASEFVSGRPVWGEIIGVVGDVRGSDHLDSRDSPKPQVYAPFFQSQRIFGVYMLVRSAGDPRALIPAIQDRIWSVNRNQPITAIATLNGRIAQVNVSPRSQTVLLGIFAAFGFLLALVGVYGVMSYLVSLQTREIGIRMALGAIPLQILGRVLIRGTKLALTGVVIGTLCGFLLSRFMSSLLFAISPTDPLTYIGVSVFLLCVTVSAAFVPARRAARVDPIIALRYE
ncbi:MAG TPA: ABC transporter permease [Candidatus Sulfotelmatobacter sp.]|nr:ABC transporter permease [Candidatus Sulfotelmatobacter sp.]